MSDFFVDLKDEDGDSVVVMKDGQAHRLDSLAWDSKDDGLHITLKAIDGLGRPVEWTAVDTGSWPIDKIFFRHFFGLELVDTYKTFTAPKSRPRKSKIKESL